MDPLDVGEPTKKAWSEFRTSFASGFFLAWLASDFEEIAPYFEELRDAIEHADLCGPMFEKEAQETGERWDGYVPISRDSGRTSYWVPLEEAELFQQMFFAEGTTQEDHQWGLYGLATVALHSSLEAYCGALGISLKRISLPKAVIEYLAGPRETSRLAIQQLDVLRDCDATRHVFVHNRGIVDEEYIRAVVGAKFLIGERRPLAHGDVVGFAHVVWAAASALRAKAAG